MSIDLDPVTVGGEEHVLTAIRDVTERRRLDAERERVLADAQRRAAEMDAIFESIADGLFVCGKDGTVVRSNPAVDHLLGVSSLVDWPVHERLTLLRLEDAVGRPLRREDTANQRALRGEVVRGMTQVAHRSDGATLWLSVSAAPIRTGGEIVGAVVTFTDRTEERRAAEALREEDRRKSEFLGVLSHELRNPLAPIRNSIYLLDRAAPGSEQASRAKEILRRQTEHLTHLVDDLLDVTRISSGKVELHRSVIDLRDVVRSTTDDHRSLFDQSGVELRVEHSVGPVWIDADPTRIAQVLGNLLQNAAKFTPSGGTVTVGVATSGGEAELHVRDDGIGIEPAQVERMFEPFQQADHSLARAKGGLGLGLALVKGLVELHGGTVRARSEGLGKGAEFVVALPLVPSRPGEAPPPDAQAASGRLVVVIEDNVDAAQSLADMLQLNGYRVRTARDGRSGIRLVQEARPSVVLCDLGLPDVDGFEVARALRRDDALRSVRLIALSGYAQPEDVQRASDAGFDGHLAKPATLEAITEIIERGRR